MDFVSYSVGFGVNAIGVRRQNAVKHIHLLIHMSCVGIYFYLHSLLNFEGHTIYVQTKHK